MRKVNLLVILDGFGHNESSANNAIAMADTPTWDNLWQSQPHTLISGSGEDVGLPAGQMGKPTSSPEPEKMSACPLDRWVIPKSAI